MRTVVVKLKDGTLWVNSPQWPTGEFCALLDELGPVGHVVLPCVALEHKAPLKAFTKKYPKASVWVAPGQYGPFGECGLDVASAKMGYRVDGIFPIGAPKASDPAPPWADEFDYKLFYEAAGNHGIALWHPSMPLLQCTRLFATALGHWRHRMF